MALLGSIDHSKVLCVFFLTMTGPKGSLAWGNIEQRRKAWELRARRRWPGSWSIVWRKEPHADGTPHLNGLMFWMDSVPHLVDEFRPWNDRAWSASIGRSDAESVCCNVQMMKSIQGVNYYIAKYMSKPSGDDVQSFTGRAWGCIRRDQLPINMHDDSVRRAVLRRVTRVLVKLQQRRRQRVEIRDPRTGRWWTCSKNPWGLPDDLLRNGITDERSYTRWAKWMKGQRGGRIPDDFGWADGHVRLRMRRVRVVRRVEVVQFVPSSFGPDGTHYPASVVPTGDVEHVPPSLHFCTGMEKLVSWGKSEYVRRLEESEGLPF